MEKKVRSVFLYPLTGTKPVIFCFNHAGGNARAFSSWREVQGAEIIPLEMPGHGIRSMEEPLDDIETLAEEYSAAIADAAGEEIAFSLFGHSLGAVIAFRTAQLLIRRYNIYPCCLQVSGVHAPQDEDTSSYRTGMGTDALICEIISLGHTPAALFECREYRDYIVPVLFSDYRMKESFSYDGDTVDIPVYAYSGRSDTEASPEIMKRWELVSSEGFSIREFEGDHFYLFEQGIAFARMLVSDMLESCEEYG